MTDAETTKFIISPQLKKMLCTVATRRYSCVALVACLEVEVEHDNLCRKASGNIIFFIYLLLALFIITYSIYCYFQCHRLLRRLILHWNNSMVIESFSNSVESVTRDALSSSMTALFSALYSSKLIRNGSA